MKKTTYFFRKSVVYPSVIFQEIKDSFVFSNTEFCYIIAYIEHFGMLPL